MQQMKITEIDSSSSEIVSGQERWVVFRTKPPLSDEIWNKFCAAGLQAGFWRKIGDSLVWTGDSALGKEFVDQTEQHLTAVENSLNAAQTRSADIKQNYLSQISKQTGRPVV